MQGVPMATSKPAPSGKPISKAPRIIDESNRQELDQAIQRRVSQRAYEIYESSGSEHGYHDTHWFQAENEIIQRGLETRESGSWLSINAYIPDVSAEDIEVYLEPQRVIVHAEKREGSNSESQIQEFTRRDIFLLEDLNTEVDPSTASAAFKDQKLTLMVKKRLPGDAGASSTNDEASRS